MFLEHAPGLEHRCGAVDEARVAASSAALGVSAWAVRVALSRNPDLDDEALARWIHPRLGHLRPPSGMAGFEAALALLADAVQHDRRIGVFGDYDADGVTSSCMLSSFLRELGATVVATVASREGGYGFTVERAKTFADAGCELVLTADCGTSDHEALGWLRARGIRSVVIDHHQVPEVSPPTDAFINPWQPGCDFVFKHLCSAGVAFYLCAALRTHLRGGTGGERSLPDPRAWLDVAAIGTICDMVPLIDENRVLVRQGLTGPSVRNRPALRGLLHKSRVRPHQEVTEGFIGFTVGPRLNAPGRLGAAEPALRWLSATSDAEAAQHLKTVETINRARKSHQVRVVDEAREMLRAHPELAARPAIALASETWPHGVVGLAAGTLASEHRRPAFVMAVDAATGEVRGSARTDSGVNVHRALQDTEGLLLRHGGHPAAAGFSLSMDRLEAFVDALQGAVQTQRAQLGEVAPTPYDAALALEEVSASLVHDLRAAAPFGQQAPAPVFLTQDARVRVTRVFAQQHLEIVLAQGGVEQRAVFFGGAGAPLSPGDRVSCLFEPEIDTYRGPDRVALRIQHLWRT